MRISKTPTKSRAAARTPSSDEATVSMHALKRKDAAFNALIKKISKSYGVQVAAAPTPVKNPYAMPAEKAAKVVRRAGIITRSGKLSRVFK